MEEFILNHGSYLAIIVILTLSGAGLPVPEEVPVAAAGVLSSPDSQRLDPTLAFGACLLGALLGDCLMYGIGRYLGTAYLRRHPWFARILHEERERQMESLLQQQGLKVLLLARFLVGIRSPMYLAAGILRVNFARFLAADLVCAAVVVGTFFWLCHFFGGWVGPLLRKSQWVVTGVFVLVLVLVVVYAFVWRSFGRRLRLGSMGSPSSPGVSAKHDSAGASVETSANTLPPVHDQAVAAEDRG